jgi:hypothetical protein
MRKLWCFSLQTKKLLITGSQMTNLSPFLINFNQEKDHFETVFPLLESFFTWRSPVIYRRVETLPKIFWGGVRTS